jgi:3-hydroxyacyl-CoA dehydrogenase / enoyl-CoA hydratase / 3-hydroxybutyryl-CoA epimerase
MIDLPSALMPADAPESGACVRLERPEPGLAVLVLDPPHRKKAVLDLPLMRDLADRLEGIASERDLRGLVITGREPTSFAVGADLDALAEIKDPAVATRLARFGQETFGRIAKLRLRTVAAIGGPVPGGAFELALACDLIVACDDRSTRIGLPETQLGILPGWGGSQRLPRRVGVPRALEAILTGKLYPARQARKLGLVDRLTQPEYLLRIAANLAMGRERLRKPKRGAWYWFIDRNPIARSQIAKRASADLAKRAGGHYPALPRALELVLDAPSTPFERGLEREAAALGELAVTPVCKSLVALFRLSEDAKKLARLPDGSEPKPVRRAGVVGAGVMGGAIAGLCAERGIEARLADLAPQALDAALLAHRERVAKDLARRRLEPHEARAALDRLEVSRTLDGFARCDLVLEAVAEKLEVKRKVLGDLAARLRPDALLASNTSSLSVGAMAEGLPHPERVVGMHFFNPVQRMPLVEIVRGRATSDVAVAKTAQLALALGKTPLVVADVPGFLVNRLLAPYLDEAARLCELGVAPEQVERAARAFGLPMGPLELIDEVGLDIAAHAAQSLFAGYGERMRPSALLGRLLEKGLTGKKSGGGFYVWRDAGHGRIEKGGFHPELARALPPPTQPPRPDAEVTDRLVLALVAEAWRALEERVVDSERALDLASVFGMGFPPFLGGIARYARARGLGDIASALRGLMQSPDVAARGAGAARFEAPASLVAEAVPPKGMS